MKNRGYRFFGTLALFLAGFFVLFVVLLNIKNKRTERRLPKRIHSTSSPEASVKAKKARWEYFFRMLRDPATNSIPRGIRQKELAYARTLPRIGQGIYKVTSGPQFTWHEAGPVDVGGRTRALAVDVANSNVIIAGGVSGGIWKSTDGGASWTLKNNLTQNLSVTSLAQDPRSGHTDTWYYATGEFDGNTASDRGWRARFYGSGLYRSTDNGETWQLMVPAGSSVNWDSYFDYVSRIVVSPITGSVFIACNGGYIYRSDNGLNSASPILGGPNDHYYTDVVVASNGIVIASLSQFNYYTYQGTQYNTAFSPGIYKSTNDGQSWTDITPQDFPEHHQRTVLATAPSNPDVVYALTFTGDKDENDHEDVRFFKINLSTGTSEDRSANLPDFGDDDSFIDTQGNYNMVVAVKPDDENFVLIGATSLFRSTNGFSTKPQDKYYTWIGGYHPTKFHYPNQHPDQHVIAFDPNNPKRMWCGHDGGLSFTADITASSTKNSDFPWIDKNNGYNVTQFYTVAISQASNDDRILGGTQDNGTPYFRWNGSGTTPSTDFSSGDGGYCYLGKNFAYVSSQNGRILRLRYDQSGNVSWDKWSIITPVGASDQLFIDPFVVDPTDENVMYYSGGDVLWRNNALSSIPNFQDSTAVGWTELTNLSVPSGFVISTIAVSRNNPSHVLYYGASSWNDVPKVYRLVNADTATTGAEEISIPDAASGTYIHSIAVNPNDANEILVVLSNYKIVGLYHSTDGGHNYTAVEGNLEGDTPNPGPSLRSATILPSSQGTIYIVGTSTGIYSTTQLDGSNTVWKQEAANEMGNVVVEYVTSRTSDGRVAAGTHGRGIFIGDINTTGIENNELAERPKTFYLAQNYPNPFNPTTTITYTLPTSQHVLLKVYDARGREVAKLVDEQKKAGTYNVNFNAGKLPSGIYVYRLTAGNYTKAKKLLLLK